MRPDLAKKRSDRKIEDIGLDPEEALDLVVKLNYELTMRWKAREGLDIVPYFFYFTSRLTSVASHSCNVGDARARQRLRPSVPSVCCDVEVTLMLWQLGLSK